MMRTRLLTFVAALALLAAGRAGAEVITATSTANNSPYPSYLIAFDTDNPGTLLSKTLVTGADVGTPATGNPGGQQFIISGIDYRPSTNQLYGLGYRSGFEQRVYTIDPATGTATGVPTDFLLFSASSAGFNFDPVRDTIRLTSDQGGNVRINPTTGTITSNTNLTYAADDPNAGVTPRVASVAYTNHAGTPGTATLYGIDARNGGTLVQIGATDDAASADAGQLHTVGDLNLGFDIPADTPVAFFISPVTGNAYATIEPVDGAPSFLLAIDLDTGAATELGQIGPSGTLPVWGMTTPVPEPGSLALAGAGLAGAVGWLRRRKARRS